MAGEALPPQASLDYIDRVLRHGERHGMINPEDVKALCAEVRLLMAEHPVQLVTAQGPDQEGSISCMLRTSEFRGDHGADVSQAQRIKPGETVTSLVFRLIKERRLPRSCDADPANDVIELRRIQEP